MLCDKCPSNEKQQYRISISYNKVFEIEERKKYCSDVCFRRSLFVLGKFEAKRVFINVTLGQVDSKPLWLREGERRNFEFLTDNIGLPGKEVQFEVFADLDDNDNDSDQEVSTG